MVISSDAENMAPSIKLRHVNGDTTWLLSISNLPSHPTPFNLLIDPWLSGWQKDYSRYFSRQIHVVKPCAASIPHLIHQLPEGQTVNAILVAHDFTDHCNFDTLKEADRGTKVFAHPNAIKILKGWGIFDHVFAEPVDKTESTSLRSLAEGDETMPEEVGLVYIPTDSMLDVTGIRLHGATIITIGDYFVVYSPHGLPPTAAKAWREANQSLQCLALIHNFDQITIGLSVNIGGPLNMGPSSGVGLSKLLGARKWVQTHDEMKRGEGIVAAMLHRREWDAESCNKLLRKEGVEDTEAIVLETGQDIVLT